MGAEIVQAPAAPVISLGTIRAQIEAYVEAGDAAALRELHAKAKGVQEYVRERSSEHEAGLEAQAKAVEAVLRIERGLGAVLAEKVRRGRRKSSDSEYLTLADLNIAPKQSSRFQKLARLPEDVFEERIQIVIKKAHGAIGGAASSAVSDGEDYSSDEYYTPELYLELVRDVFGGEIELDPATCEMAQELVRAQVFYTAADKGESGEEWRAVPWRGKTFLNPPYSDPAPLIEKLLGHLGAGDVPEAIVLVNNTTDTDWAQLLLANAAAVCFTKGRIAFLRSEADPTDPTKRRLAETKGTRQGQAFFYFGNDPDSFANSFSDVGEILRPSAPLYVPQESES